MNNLKKIKCFFKRLNPFYKTKKIDISLYQDEFVLLEKYDFSDVYNKGLYTYLGNGKFRETLNKFRTHTINHSKKEKDRNQKNRHWYHKTIYIYFPRGQEFSINLSTGYPNSFFVEVSTSSDYNFTIHFWFIFNVFFSIKKLPKFYIEWFRKRLKEYTYSKRLSFSFHHSTFWWNLWTNDSEISNKNKFRKGIFDIRKFIIGNSKIKIKYKDSYTYKVYFKEGYYNITSISSLYKVKYKRFGFIFNKTYNRYQIVTGIFEEVKKFDELKEYQYVKLISEYEYKGKKVLLNERIKKNVNNGLEYIGDSKEVYKIDSLNKDLKTVKFKCGKEVHWACVKESIKEEKGVPIPGDAIYSLGSLECRSHYESIGYFIATISKYRGSGEWVP